MSDNPQNQLQRLAALVEDLRRQLAAKQVEIDTAVADRNTIQEERVRDQDAAHLAINQANVTANNAAASHAAELAQLNGNLSRVTTERDTALKQRDDLSAKFAAKELEPGSGILCCPGYQTSDGQHHESVDSARRHQEALDYETSMKCSQVGVPIPKDIRARIVARLDKVRSN